MASHVTVTPNTGTDKTHLEVAGPSYAHAVRFKPADNKENINDEVIQRSHSPTKIKQMEIVGQPLVNDDNDGSFTPVINHSRRDRKNERNKRDKGRESKLILNGLAKDDSKDKQKEHSNRDKTNTEKTEAPNTEKTDVEKKIFVEAPLPKVNPWRLNKNAAQVLATKETNSNTGNRVLQPQRQDAAINGQSSSIIRAKDKRKCNHRVSNLFIMRIMHLMFFEKRIVFDV